MVSDLLGDLRRMLSISLLKLGHEFYNSITLKMQILFSSNVACLQESCRSEQVWELSIQHAAEINQFLLDFL